MIAKSKKQRNKRYYLHQKAKKICNIETTKRTIYCKETEVDNLKSNKYIASLLNNYGYSIQIELHG